MPFCTSILILLFLLRFYFDTTSQPLKLLANAVNKHALHKILNALYIVLAKKLSNVEKKKHLPKKCLVRYLYFHEPKSAAEISINIQSGTSDIRTGIKELISEGVINK